MLLLLFIFIYPYNENRINFARITLYQIFVRHISQKKKKNGKTLQRAFTHSHHFYTIHGENWGSKYSYLIPLIGWELKGDKKIYL